jgi:hypothetical protein
MPKCSIGIFGHIINNHKLFKYLCITYLCASSRFTAFTNQSTGASGTFGFKRKSFSVGRSIADAGTAEEDSGIGD